MKRFLCIFLCFSLFFCFFPISVSASDTEPAGSLNKISFFPYCSLDSISGDASPSFIFSGECSFPFSARVWFVSLASDVQPSSVIFNGVTGKLVSSNSHVFTYSFDLDEESPLVLLDLKVNFSSGTHSVVISDMYVYLNRQWLVTNADMSQKLMSKSDPKYYQFTFPDKYFDWTFIDANTNVIISALDSTQHLIFGVPSSLGSLDSADYVTVRMRIPCSYYYDKNYQDGHFPSFFPDSLSTLIDVPVLSYGSPSSEISSHYFPLVASDYFWSPQDVGNYSKGSYVIDFTFDISKLGSFDRSQRFFLDWRQAPTPQPVKSDGRYQLYYAGKIDWIVFGENVDSSSPFPMLFSTLRQIISRLDSLVDSDAPSPNADGLDSSLDSMAKFDSDSFGSIDSNSGSAGSVVAQGIGSFSGALSFLSRYVTGVSNGIQKYLIVFTLPIFVGVFLYACSRVPGIVSASRSRSGRRNSRKSKE